MISSNTGLMSTTKTVILLVTYAPVLAKIKLASGVTCALAGTFSRFEEMTYFCKEAVVNIYTGRLKRNSLFQNLNHLFLNYNYRYK